jgi:hypothetical protein
MSKAYLHSPVHCITIHNRHMESTLSIHQQMNRQTWCMYIMLNFKQGRNPATWSDIDGPEGHYTKQNKPVIGSMILLICGIQKRQTHISRV